MSLLGLRVYKHRFIPSSPSLFNHPFTPFLRYSFAFSSIVFHLNFSLSSFISSINISISTRVCRPRKRPRLGQSLSGAASTSTVNWIGLCAICRLPDRTMDLRGWEMGWAHLLGTVLCDEPSLQTRMGTGSTAQANSFGAYGLDMGRHGFMFISLLHSLIGLALNFTAFFGFSLLAHHIWSSSRDCLQHCLERFWFRR